MRQVAHRFLRQLSNKLIEDTDTLPIGLISMGDFIRPLG